MQIYTLSKVENNQNKCYNVEKSGNADGVKLMLAFYLSLIDDEEDKAKFTRIFEKYKAPMKKYAATIVGDNHFAEDIVQEAFIRVALHIDGVEENNSHKTNSFIVTIVRNVCMDFLKKEKRQNVTYVEDPDTQILPKIRKEWFSFEELDFNELVKTIKGLPQIYRDVLLFKFYHGFTDKEIAEFLDISMPTVRKRIERARDLLQYSIKEWRK